MVRKSVAKTQVKVARKKSTFSRTKTSGAAHPQKARRKAPVHRKTIQKEFFYGGFFTGSETILVKKQKGEFVFFEMRDGDHALVPRLEKFEIVNNAGKRENVSGARNFIFSKDASGFLWLTYKKSSSVWRAVSTNGFAWKNAEKLSGVLVPGYFAEEKMLFTSRRGIHLAQRGGRGNSWKTQKDFLFAPRSRGFDSGAIEIIGAFPEAGHTLIAYVSEKEGERFVGLALVELKHSGEVLWRSDVPFWTMPREAEDSRIVAFIKTSGAFCLYLETARGIEVVRIPFASFGDFIAAEKKPILNRFEGNPIIKPIESHSWESKAAFNPTAVYDDGRVHIVYRAIGDSDQSVLGYAESRDGVHIDERLPFPIYVPREPFEGVSAQLLALRPASYISPFMSGGGGAGGCEDPRLVRIGDRYYMTYVAYDGGSAPRVAITSISRDDFLKKDWKWERPVLISAPRVVDKNACIFPEKINGKYVILHRIFPNIQIDFVDDLDFDGKRFLEIKGEIKTRDTHWDSRKLGAGAAPIKTEAGWLLIYQGVDDRDDTRYKIGAMLLDLNDPTKVLVRARHPIMEPLAPYENSGWKGGVVYPCGAVVIKDTLFVYYGAGDSVTCVATAPLESFLMELKNNQNPKLEPVMRPKGELSAEGIFS